MGCVSLLVALSETSNKGVGPVGTAAWFVVVMAAALGIVGYRFCKQDGIRVSIAYLIIPILLMAAFAELVFFRDIVAALASHPVSAQQSASVKPGSSMPEKILHDLSTTKSKQALLRLLLG